MELCTKASGSYMQNATTRTRPIFGFSIVPSSITDGRRPNDLFVTTYRGALTNDLFAEVQYSQKRFGFRDSGGSSTDIFDSPFLTRTQALGHYNAPYFDATDPEDRNNRQLTGNVTWFLSSRSVGSHSLKAGFERYTSTNIGGNSQTATGYVFRTNYAVGPDGSPLVDADQQVSPVFTTGPRTLIFNWLATRGARIDINTTSFFVNDEWALDEHFSFNLGVRGETIDSEATGGITTVDTSSVVPRLGVAYDPLGDGRFTIQSTYSHYAGKYSETQFAETTNVGNPDVLIGIYTGPSGQGRDFAPGFNPDNYFIVDGSFASQNVFLDPGLKSPLTKEFTVSAGGTLGNRGHLKATYIRRRAGNFIEDFLDLTTGATEIMHEGQSYGTFVNQLFRNTDELERNYDALQFDGRYSLTSRFQLDGSYTVQIRNEGNFEGEGTNQPGVPSIAFGLPGDLPPRAQLSVRAVERLPAAQDPHMGRLQPRPRLGRRRRPGRHLALQLGAGLQSGGMRRPAQRPAGSDPGGVGVRQRPHVAGPVLRRARHREFQGLRPARPVGAVPAADLADGAAVLQVRAVQRVQPRQPDRLEHHRGSGLRRAGGRPGPADHVREGSPVRRRNICKQLCAVAGRRGRRADVQDVARLPFLGFQAYRLESAAAAAAAGSSFGSDSGSTGTRSRKLAQQSTNRLAVPAVTSSSGRPSGSPSPRQSDGATSRKRSSQTPASTSPATAPRAVLAPFAVDQALEARSRRT